MPDRFHNGVRLLQYLVVPEAQHMKARCVEEVRSDRVLIRHLDVLSTIDFNNQSPLKTNKIQNRSFEGMLPAKLHAELLSTQALPKRVLSVGHRSAQVSGCWFGEIAGLTVHC